MNNALLIIDVQNGLINQHTKHLPLKIARFLENNQFNHILFFKFINQLDSNFVKRLNWKGMMKSPETDIAHELKKFVDQNCVFEKSSFSVFRSDKFVQFIEKKNVRKLYICGLDTHACIYTTTMEAFERGFEVKVIENLCAASHGKEYHQKAIEFLKRNLGQSVLY